MNQGTRRRIGIVLSALVLAGNYSPWVRALSALPDALYLSSGQTHVLETGLFLSAEASGGAVAVTAPADEHTGVALEAVSGGETSVTFSLLGLFPVHETKVSVAAERRLIPGGQAVGVALRTQGVLVVAKPEQAQSALRAGDVIVSVQEKPVVSAQDLTAQLASLTADTVTLGVVRGGREIQVQASAPVDEADGRRRLGVWVRDSTAGVGTLSYIDPQSGAYGALGHAIVDADTGDMLGVADGAILRAGIVGVTRGQSGKAGELKGSFLRENVQIGSLVKNSVYGIYGVMNGAAQESLYPQGVPVGSRSAVHTGPATIIATVDGGGPAEYSIEILRCFAQESPSQKGMILRVTDERLLAKTGGIVQGMSGSPILQDGRLIGAVTHVYLSDAAQGYGMYIEWMLEQSDALDEGGQAA